MNLTCRTSAIGTLATVLACASFQATAQGQTVYPAYRIQTQTIYEEQPVTVYRLNYETVIQEQQVTTQKPVWETETRVRRYTVAKPVNETSTQIQRSTVRKAVCETETRMQQRTVRRPVTEQVLQNRSHVTCQPVTTMQTQLVDQGGFVDQMVLTQQPSRNRLQWLQGGYVVNPATGTTQYQRGGLHWVPTAPPAVYQVQRQYVPNVVSVEVPHTTYQQQVVNEQVPVNVTRYVDEVVEEPVQVQVNKWVDEVVEQPIQVTTQRIEYETKEEPVQVRVCKWMTDTQTVQVPHTVAKWVAETSTRMVPRTVTMRVPIDSCSPCATTTAPSTVTYYAPASVQTIAPTVSNRVLAPAQTPPTIISPAPETSPTPAETPSDDTPTGEPTLRQGSARIVPIPDFQPNAAGIDSGSSRAADDAEGGLTA